MLARSLARLQASATEAGLRARSAVSRLFESISAAPFWGVGRYEEQSRLRQACKYAKPHRKRATDAKCHRSG